MTRTTTQSQPGSVLISGAGGYTGQLLSRTLATQAERLGCIVATDIRLPAERVPGVLYEELDITDKSAVRSSFERHRVETVVHLAAVVTPPPKMTRQQQRQIDVEGTRHLLEACRALGSRKFIYTSSGAAYGYHPDNSALIQEDHPLRGNEIFTYAWHKRLVEELLAEYRTKYPELDQLIFRVSTILGASVNNQITAMFERPIVLGLAGVDTPFCFIWDADVVACLTAGVLNPEANGIFNLTADGVMTLREIAAAMNHRYVALPEAWVRTGLSLPPVRSWLPYGPEQTLFLRYRPVLSNQRLKEAFGFTPSKTSRQVFEVYRASRN